MAYLTPMIRDFLDHMLLELRIAKFELENPAQISPELMDQERKLFKRHKAIPRPKPICLVKNPEEAAAARAFWLPRIDAWIEAFQTLRPALDEALQACGGSEPRTETWDETLARETRPAPRHPDRGDPGAEGSNIAWGPGTVPQAQQMTEIAVADLRAEAARPERGPCFDLLNRAQVVFGKCTETGKEFLLFGRGHLRRVAETGNTEKLITVRVRLDHTAATDDLEFVAAVLQLLRGHHDYKGPSA